MLNRSAVEQLIEKWRKEADERLNDPDNAASGWYADQQEIAANRLKKCADDLAAALVGLHAERRYTVEEVLQILKNVGKDVDCGACMETAFCGLTTAPHECAVRPPQTGKE